MLSSSFAMTPAFAKRKLRLVPTAKISDELLKKSVARQDFIRIIPNPGFRPNSMKNVPKVRVIPTILLYLIRVGPVATHFAANRSCALLCGPSLSTSARSDSQCG
jgi:hypothetical protein